MVKQCRIIMSLKSHLQTITIILKISGGSFQIVQKNKCVKRDFINVESGRRVVLKLHEPTHRCISEISQVGYLCLMLTCLLAEETLKSNNGGTQSSALENRVEIVFYLRSTQLLFLDLTQTRKQQFYQNHWSCKGEELFPLESLISHQKEVYFMFSYKNQYHTFFFISHS